VLYKVVLAYSQWKKAALSTYLFTGHIPVERVALIAVVTEPLCHMPNLKALPLFLSDAVFAYNNFSPPSVL
jgi:hypothetical protein